MRLTAIWHNRIFPALKSNVRAASPSPSPFMVMVRKEMSDHIRSWRFIVLLLMILLTCFGSLYISITHLPEALSNANDPNRDFVFLKLLTASDGSLPPFHVLLGFLGPLLGIGMGFDAVNSEQNNGTLIRVMAQPIPRDYLINAKFTGAIAVIALMFVSLSLLLTGLGMIITGLSPSFEEVLRIAAFVFICIVYVAFWLNLSILFSVKFRRAATSALTAIAVWLFFTVFYQIIIGMTARAFAAPAGSRGSYMLQKFLVTLIDIAPGKLFTDATSTLLIPSVRSLGPLSIRQMQGAIPSSLSFTDSLMVVWPQLTGLIAATIVCFSISYYLFMRREIR
ncbi:ABC transporter permease [Sinomicrobium soli]|uniref:ABC transporter permease n=1 Tax=Sinomicrobium sp. N-1-3-6 TaxID=2219864 RepID=UPI000DCF1E58|nr:ABC transporter permease [Sinomicrobium sp. N-1-3-6]RAV28014.1 ABC transporter permease [Sinomicrobium sp. N-1-3-6]